MLEKNIVKNPGFVFEEVQQQDWVLGSSAIQAETLYPKNTNWEEMFLGSHPDMQFNNNFDSFSCVIFSIARALVCELRSIGINITISEMFNAVMAGVQPGVGTSVRSGMESFRKNGFVQDIDYPFTASTTKEQYFSYPPKKIIELAKSNSLKFSINWEALTTDSNVPHSLVLEELNHTPVVLSGRAWIRNSNTGLYVDEGQSANHCFLGIRNNNGLIRCGDSYPFDWQYDNNSDPSEFLKDLDPSFRIWSAHRVVIKPINEQATLLFKIKNMFKKIYRDVHGGLWFVDKVEKDGKVIATGKQKITDFLSLAGAMVDEIGIPKEHNNVPDSQMNNFINYKFFGK